MCGLNFSLRRTTSTLSTSTAATTTLVGGGGGAVNKITKPYQIQISPHPLSSSCFLYPTLKLLLLSHAARPPTRRSSSGKSFGLWQSFLKYSSASSPTVSRWCVSDCRTPAKIRVSMSAVLFSSYGTLCRCVLSRWPLVTRFPRAGLSVAVPRPPFCVYWTLRHRVC